MAPKSAVGDAPGTFRCHRWHIRSGLAQPRLAPPRARALRRGWQPDRGSVSCLRLDDPTRYLAGTPEAATPTTRRRNEANVAGDRCLPVLDGGHGRADLGPEREARAGLPASESGGPTGR